MTIWDTKILNKSLKAKTPMLMASCMRKQNTKKTQEKRINNKGENYG